jgi:Domain of unknown function (DUF4166)
MQQLAPQCRFEPGGRAELKSSEVAALGDLRYRALLKEDEWAALPPAVRKRFSKRLGPGATAVYAGRVSAVRISRIGMVLAQVLRLIGAPLPLSRATGVASVVTVTEDAQSGGQVWTRMYGRETGVPQVIHSVKRFAGPTGLEECIGYGLAMSLTIAVENGALVFRAKDYTVAAAGRRWVMPRWLRPGALTVTHKATSETAFLFSLDVTHPLLGTLVYQEAMFESEML